MADKKKRRYQNLLSYEVIKDYKRMEISINAEPPKSEFTYIIMNTGYTSRLITSEIHICKFVHILKRFPECEVKYIEDHIWGKGLYLFDKSLNTDDTPNKLNYLLNISETFGSVVFYFKNGISLNRAVRFTEKIRSIDYCRNFGCIQVLCYYNIFRENSLTFNHRYFSNILDGIFPKGVATLISDYYDKENTVDGTHAISFKYDTESG